MPLKHAALVGATALLFVVGLGVGFTGTEAEVDHVAPIECGSFLSPDTTAAAFKHDVAVRSGEDPARLYAHRCEEVRSSRQVPTYSALGLGVIGLFASALIFGRDNRPFMSPL